MPATVKPSYTEYSATFRNLKVPTKSGTELLKCELEMLLIPSMVRTWLYYVCYAVHRKPVSLQLRTLQQAKEATRLLFEEQLTEWVSRDEIEAQAARSRGDAD